MPLSRYTISSEYCLGSRDLYHSCSCNDPDAVLQGVAMAGYVGILRQLGDLAQLASEVFQELHEQVAAAAARGHDLAQRLQRVEAEMPLIDKHFSSRHHCLSLYLACNTAARLGLSWRANLKQLSLSHGIVSNGNDNGDGRPRFVVQHLQRCRGPPKLSMLDKFDAGGEGACLSRYTDPSFFRTHSASAKLHPLPNIMEIRPILQSSSNYKLPKLPITCSRPQRDAYDKPPDGFLSMFRRLKYRQANGPVVQISTKPETQTQKFHMEDSSEQRSSATHHSQVNTRSTDSPESRTQMVHIPVAGASVSEKKACECDLDRTSSFEAWLSPDATEITEEAPCSNANGFVSYVTSSGALAASPKKQARDSSDAAEEVYHKKGMSKRSRFTSRVSKFPRKIFVRKHDPLANSFSNIAKNLLHLRYDAVRDNESYDFELDSEDYDTMCLEMSQCCSVDDIKDDSNDTEKDPSDLERHVHDSFEDEPAAATAAADDDIVHSPADGGGVGRCKLAAVSPRFRQELIALACASDGPSSPNSLDYRPTTMKASEMAAKNSSEDVPNLDEAALDDKSTEFILEQVISDAAIVSLRRASKKFDETCEGMDDDESRRIVSCGPETIPKEQTCVPLLVTNPVFSRHKSIPDSEQCYLQPETTSLKSTTGPLHDASVDEEVQVLHQCVRKQELSGSSIPYACSTTSECPENFGYYTSTPHTRDLLLPSTPSCRGILDESVHEQATVRSRNENVCSEDGIVPPLPPMQWLSVKVNTVPGITSPKLTALMPKSPVINHAAMRNSLQPVRTQKSEMIQTSSQHRGFISQTDIAQILASNGHAAVDISHVHGAYRNSFLSKGSDEISPQEPSRKSHVRLSEGGILKAMESLKLTVHADEARSELVKGEQEDFYRKSMKISAVHEALLPVSELNRLRKGDQVDVQNSQACQSNQDQSVNVSEGNVFFSALQQLRIMSPPSVPTPKYSLVEVESRDRSKLEVDPITIYPPRKLSGGRSILLEQIKEKSLSLKPVCRRSTTMMDSPRNSKVATILQRADDIRQAHADSNEIDNEDSWSASD